MLAQKLREKLLKSGAAFKKRQRESIQPTSFVRIDNFQRPLQVRSLKQFLEEKIGRPLSDADLWLNSIKTHCYVTLSSEDEAKLLRDSVHGVHWPESNPNALQANFTQYSAAAAPMSDEAMRRPGEWLNAPPPAQIQHAVSQPETSSNSENVHDIVPNQQGEVGFTTKRRRQENEVAPLTIEYRDIEPVRSGRDSQHPTASASRLPRPADTRVLVLDELFKKTTATPHLYWLPVTEEVAAANKAKQALKRV